VSINLSLVSSPAARQRLQGALVSIMAVALRTCPHFVNEGEVHATNTRIHVQLGIRSLHSKHPAVSTIIRHQLDLDGPVSSSSNSLFRGLPSRLRPFGLEFSIIFAILLLFILVTRRSKCDLYLLSLSSTGSAFNSSKTS
jgi:hypothetical protein